MNTIDEKEEEFAHIILGISGENIAIFGSRDLVDGMNEFIGGYYPIIGEHEFS